MPEYLQKSTSNKQRIWTPAHEEAKGSYPLEARQKDVVGTYTAAYSKTELPLSAMIMIYKAIR